MVAAGLRVRWARHIELVLVGSTNSSVASDHSSGCTTVSRPVSRAS